MARNKLKYYKGLDKNSKMNQVLLLKISSNVFIKVKSKKQKTKVA